MHKDNWIQEGKAPGKEGKVLVMLHGRGATAGDILSLAGHLEVKDFTLAAPQATNHSWYPYSFMAPLNTNEPWLSSAIALLRTGIERLKENGVDERNIYFLGFSQGACLALEYTARHAIRYGGVIAFTGGLIGDSLFPDHYTGSFERTPVFIGSSDPDPHVPAARVKESAAMLEKLGADVTMKLYPGLGHTVNADELEIANRILKGEGYVD